MRKKIMLVGCLILLLSLPLALPVSGFPYDSELPTWDQGFSYREELQIPISTDNSNAIAQPIDLRISFSNPCWAYNETKHSIRVVCWDGSMWHELESQIYDLQNIEGGSTTLKECNVVFLIPPFAKGTEHYFVYYDDQEKSSPGYTDHVNIEDASYSASPLPDISAQATYYGIWEDGYIIYGVGQKGTFLDRSLAQVVVKQKPKSTQFDILNADQIASFAFSYTTGKKESDEISSDQTLILKKVFVNGNLMTEFGIISESSDGILRTSAMYKYYYTPLEQKRICVHVKHEILRDVTVKGDDNLDGRYGALISFKSRNPSAQKLNFGDILPFIDIFGKSGTVEEYPLEQNPESKEREWVITFADDVDLGTEAWLAYGYGKTGETHGLIFSANTGLVKSGTNERDGVQLKVAEREYFNFLGTEVDYASINFGRNSYDKGYSHDLTIPSDLIVEFDAELFSSNQGGYPAVQQEAGLYRDLVKYRGVSKEGGFEQEQKKYRVTVISHLGGTHFSFPWLSERTGLGLPVMVMELSTPDGTLVASGVAERSLFTRAYKTFTNITTGTYLVKVYRAVHNTTRIFVGAHVIQVEKPTIVHVFCSWQRTIQLVFSDQHNTSILGINVVLYNNHDIVYVKNTSDSSGKAIVSIPSSTRERYHVTAWYRDFIVYDKDIEQTRRKLSLNIMVGLYDLTVEVRDSLDFPPDVPIHPTLTSTTYQDASPILAVNQKPGTFLFTQAPFGQYHLQLSYGNVVDEKDICIPECGDSIQLVFSAEHSLSLNLFDIQGNPLCDTSIHVIVTREGKTIQDYSTNQQPFILPPAHYTLKMYQGDDLVGQNDVYLTSDQNLQVVTTLQSPIPLIIIIISLITLGIICALIFSKKIPRSSILKCIALVLLLFSLILPWWTLSGISSSPTIERHIQMFVQPAVMIEKTVFTDKTTYNLATMPDVYIDFLSKVLLALGVGCFLIIISIVLDILKRRKYAFLLGFVCAIMLLILGVVFYMGTTRLSEVSVGEVQGSGILNFTINDQTVALSSQWGLDIGFYLVVLSAVMLFGICFWDFKKRFFSTKKKW